MCEPTRGASFEDKMLGDEILANSASRSGRILEELVPITEETQTA